MQNHYRRNFDTLSIRWMMGDAIEDDQSSRDVIDLAVDGFDDSAAVT
jgi:hypothetical protein